MRSDTARSAGGSEGLVDAYRSNAMRKLLFIGICCVLLLVMMGISCTLGGRDIPFLDVYEIIYKHISGATYVSGTDEWWDDYIIWDVRLPRIVVGAIAGASLALGGVAMQSMMRNPLAEPYTTGISSGACFGAVAAIVAGFSLSTALGSSGVVINSFIFSLIPAFVIILISHKTSASPATLVLAGIALLYMFDALTTTLMVSANENDLAAAYRWQIGSLDGAAWSDVPLMLIITVIGSLFLQFTSNRLNLMALGDDDARSLGMDVRKYRTVCLLLISIMAASVVSYTGVIGFVGLMAPHLVRMFLGSDNRYLAPASMALGAAMVVGFDIVARNMVTGGLPVGLIMSFIGGIMFLYLVVRRKNGYGEVY